MPLCAVTIIIIYSAPISTTSSPKSTGVENSATPGQTLQLGQLPLSMSIGEHAHILAQQSPKALSNLKGLRN